MGQICRWIDRRFKITGEEIIEPGLVGREGILGVVDEQARVGEERIGAVDALDLLEGFLPAAGLLEGFGERLHHVHIPGHEALEPPARVGIDLHAIDPRFDAEHIQRGFRCILFHRFQAAVAAGMKAGHDGIMPHDEGIHAPAHEIADIAVGSFGNPAVFGLVLLDADAIAGEE